MSAAEQLAQEVCFRDPTADDLPFVYGAWMESYGRGSPMTFHIQKSVFYPEQRHVIDRILAQRNTRTTLAVLVDDPAVILGFLVSRHFADDALALLDFVYVKGSFRQMGIASALLAHHGVDMRRAVCTHHTYDSIRLKFKYPKLLFNPYRALELSYE